MNLLVTGSASHLARVLLPMLSAHPQVQRIVGVDIKSCEFSHPKFVSFQLDIRAPEFEQLLDDIDCVIHLAFVVLRSQLKRQRRNRELMRDINVRGSINVFTLCQQHHIDIIHLSSAVIYGAWPDNPALIKENQPYRIMTGFSYAEDKVAVEQWLDNLESKPDAPRIVRLRPHIILGPNSQSFLLNLLRLPFYPRLPDPQPRLQCIWENDVAMAIISATLGQAHGAFNLAADVTNYKALIQARHPRSMSFPYSLTRLIHRVIWRLFALGEEPRWLQSAAYSLALDTQRAHDHLHWQPSRSSLQCALDSAQQSQLNNRQLDA